ncbi:hypothetical protein FQR65_LT17108 [Abscondita terminalis]|nr:hypothetical protein FQR65_LT17108 [Abscondita terminalis]
MRVEIAGLQQGAIEVELQLLPRIGETLKVMYGADAEFKKEVKDRQENKMSDSQLLTTLQEHIKRGQKYSYLCFWGHRQKTPEKIDKSCLSQWYPAKFEINGVDYQNTEQYMMAQKAKLFKDENIFQQILHTDDPKKIKALGRQVKNYQDEFGLRIVMRLWFKEIWQSFPKITISNNFC